ncbi:MAG: ubiquinol-cytochrome c reductase iron-sulfur subunit [Pseudomonadota bacterium]|nr:ubiquinol-cytochrome c reductase iron-sulfur subunit [Pseudomonadota bacterium]
MSEDSVNSGRRRFLVGATSVVGAVGAVGAAVPFIGSWNPSAKAKAAGAPVQLDLGKLEPGQMVVTEWRGKPVFVVYRTQRMLDLVQEETAVLADPDSSASEQPDYAEGPYRAIKPEFLVVLGVCTHLGCSPKYRPEVAPADLGSAWQGGFFCPCHGSRFDLSGRVYKGVPAPTNLTVPPYTYLSDNVVLIGSEEAA